MIDPTGNSNTVPEEHPEIRAKVLAYAETHPIVTLLGLVHQHYGEHFTKDWIAVITALVAEGLLQETPDGVSRAK